MKNIVLLLSIAIFSKTSCIFHFNSKKSIIFLQKISTKIINSGKKKPLLASIACTTFSTMLSYLLIKNTIQEELKDVDKQAALIDLLTQDEYRKRRLFAIGIVSAFLVQKMFINYKIFTKFQPPRIRSSKALYLWTLAELTIPALYSFLGHIFLLKRVALEEQQKKTHQKPTSSMHKEISTKIPFQNIYSTSLHFCILQVKISLSLQVIENLLPAIAYLSSL